MAVFKRTGFAKTNVADIATAAGVGKGTLYEYYPSKEELFLGVAEMMTNGFIELEQSPAIAGLPPGLRLLALFEVMVQLHAEHVDAFPLFIEFWAHAASGPKHLQTRIRELFGPKYEMWMTHFDAIVEEGKAAGEIRPDIDGLALADGMGGMFDGVAAQAAFMDRDDPRDKMRAFLRMVMRGVLVNPEDTFAAFDALPHPAAHGKD